MLKIRRSLGRLIFNMGIKFSVLCTVSYNVVPWAPCCLKAPATRLDNIRAPHFFVGESTCGPTSKDQGAVSIRKTVLPGKTVFLIETAPWSFEVGPQVDSPTKKCGALMLSSRVAGAFRQHGAHGTTLYDTVHSTLNLKEKQTAIYRVL